MSIFVLDRFPQIYGNLSAAMLFAGFALPLLRYLGVHLLDARGYHLLLGTALPIPISGRAGRSILAPRSARGRVEGDGHPTRGVCEPVNGQPRQNCRPLRFRFSLRTLAIFVLLLSISFGWVGRVAHNARVQRSAICDIRKVGGRVYYPYATSEPFEESLPKLFIRCVLGSEYVYTATQVNLNGTRVRDCDVQALSRLGALNRLCLMQTGISDSALTTLHRLDGFEEVNVEGTAVSDIGMKHLARCDQLRYLWLRDTQLSDNSVNSSSNSVISRGLTSAARQSRRKVWSGFGILCPMRTSTTNPSLRRWRDCQERCNVRSWNAILWPTGAANDPTLRQWEGEGGVSAGLAVAQGEPIWL